MHLAAVSAAPNMFIGIRNFDIIGHLHTFIGRFYGFIGQEIFSVRHANEILCNIYFEYQVQIKIFYISDQFCFKQID